MSKYLTICFLILGQYLFAQAPNDASRDGQKIQNLEKEVIQLRTELKKIESFKSEQEEIVRQTSQTINNQNSLISSFGVIYTVLTIIIAIVAIGLPFITYQFGIKPSREALKELEKNLDKKVADYLKETRKLQIKKSIEHLKGENAELKSQAISFLSLTQHEGFTDQELFEFYRLIKSGSLSDSHIGTMAYLLSSRVNEYANEIFGDKEQLKINAIKIAAYQYIPKVGIEKFLTPLKSFLKGNSNQFGEFLTLLTFTNMYSSKMTGQIFNNKELIDELSDETFKQMKPIMKQTLDNMKIDSDEFESTYLADKINKASA